MTSIINIEVSCACGRDLTLPAILTDDARSEQTFDCICARVYVVILLYKDNQYEVNVRVTDPTIHIYKF